MRRICPRIFDIPCAEANFPNDCAKSSLESLIINLSLKENGRLSTSYSRHCAQQTYAWPLHDEMIRTSENIVRRSPNLKTLRILYHKQPSLEIVARDCITGTKVILADDGDWDWNDQGKADPDDK